jgi:selenide, water dikinase
LAATVRFDDLPLIDEAVRWVGEGVATGASGRNWSSYGAEVDLPQDFQDWKQKLLTDPQTSGGLLVACAPGSVDAVLEVFRSEGFDQAQVIGELGGGVPRLRVV